MTRLSVNIDHVATIRQARKASEPDPVAAAVLAELAGADGITCHIRADRRHIQLKDLERLRQVVTTHLNVEMAATSKMLKIARSVRPDLVTLVPERAGEVTTEGGIDAARLKKKLAPHIKALRRSKIDVSLFIDPNLRQIEAAAELKVGTVELNTNAYAVARSDRALAAAFDAFVVAAAYASELGLAVAAGHGLTVRNVQAISDVPEVYELNIGHSIIARSVFFGIEGAIHEMLDAI